MTDYATFLESKAQLSGSFGFEPVWMPDFLFDFQAFLCEWSIRLGRGAVFADCGLGKSPMELVWAENVVRHTNKPVLLLTPIAVGYQMEREAEKFGVEAKRCPDGKVMAGARVVIGNYERLHLFTSSDFAGVVCDESSILKNFDGVTKAAVTEFMRLLPYRLLCTATAAPNDYIELGTSSEALGERHVHPLQLDVIERSVVLWSNPGETVLTPFMGVGSEVYGAVTAGRRGVGIELKSSYYKQAIQNLKLADAENEEQGTLAFQ